MKLVHVAAAVAALMVSITPALAWSQSAPAPSAERLKLAHQILEVQGGVANMTASLKGVEKGMVEMMAQSASSTPEMRQTILDAMDKTMSALLPHLIDQMATIYAANFDDAQLRDIVAFYQSPTGKVMVAKMPQVTQQSVAAVGKYMPQIQADLLDSMCAKMTCPEAVQQRLAKLKESIPADQRF